MSNHGKKYLDAAKKIQADKLYTPQEALTLLKEISYVKFNETVELHFRLGIDPRHSDQQVRSTVVLPHGLGKTVRVLVFAESDVARAAEAAGADIIGDDEVIARIEKDGWTEFDVALATPDMMKKVSRLGKTLGRKGLMPNPKAGTVVPAEDIARAIQEARAGRIEFRNDKTGNIHSPIGKMNFTVEQLLGNFTTLVEAVIRNKPSAAKGTYVKRLVVSSTMAPGIKIDPNITHTLV